MSDLRLRNSFRFTEDTTEESEGHVLDDQGLSARTRLHIVSEFALAPEQDHLIDQLSAEASTANQTYLYATGGLIGLSFMLQLVFFFSPSKQNPISSVFHVYEPDPPLPFSSLHSSISLILHYYLLCLSQSRFHAQIMPSQSWSLGAHLLDHPTVTLYYVAATISPVCSVILRRSWQTTIWWCFVGFLTFSVEMMGKAIESERRSLQELEGKKYVAPGA